MIQTLHDPDLRLRQSVQLIHQPIDLSIGRDDLALEHGLLLVRDRGGQLAVQIEHGLDQRDHPVVARDVGRVGEVDGADGELFDVLTIIGKVSAAVRGTNPLEVIIKQSRIQQSENILIIETTVFSKNDPISTASTTA